MKKLLNLLTGTLLVAATAAGAAPLVSSSAKDVLFINEKIAIDGTISLKARSGPLTNSDVGYGTERLSAKVASFNIPVALPRINVAGSFPTATGLPTKGMVRDIAQAAISANFPPMNAQMAAYLSKYHLGSGWFTFKQDVALDVAGASETWTIYWNYFSDAKGRGNFGNPEVVPQAPKLLYLKYTQSAVENGLPATYAFPNAGRLTWQLRDVDFLPLNAEQAIDTGGYFDSPQGAVEYTDSGISCLMNDMNPGCSPGYISVRSLLDSTGAVAAVVDYGRRVTPVMTFNPADNTYTAVMSTSFDTRDVNFINCKSATYTNTGSYGYLLENTVARYVATGEGSPQVISYRIIDQFTGQYNSPVSSFNYTLPITKSQVSSLGSVAIDPIGISGAVPGTVLINASDIPGLGYFAPLNLAGATDPVMGTFQSPGYHYDTGNDEYRVNLSFKCGSTGNYEVDAFVDHQHGHTGPYVPTGIATSVLTDDAWVDVALPGHGNSRFAAYVDTGNQQLRLVSKVTSGSYQYNNSGNYANSHNNNALAIPSTYTPGHTSPCNPAVVTDGSCTLYGNPDGSSSYQQVFMGYTTTGSFGGWDLTNGSPLVSNPVVTYDTPVDPNAPCVPVGNGQNCPDNSGG